MDERERPRYRSQRLQERRGARKRSEAPKRPSQTGGRAVSGEGLSQTGGKAVSGEGAEIPSRRGRQTLEGHVRQGERAPRRRASQSGELQGKPSSGQRRSQSFSGGEKCIPPGERHSRSMPARESRTKYNHGDMPAWERKKKSQGRKVRQTMRLLVFIVPAVFVLLLFVTLFRPGHSGDSTASVGNFDLHVSLPWDKGKGTIMLDAGHGGRDQGTSYEDVLEKDLTLEITRKIQKILEDADYRVLLTRDKDTFMDKHERADLANDKKPEIFVSIHCNFLESGQADGVETYYDPGKEEGSQPLAEAVQTHIIEKTGATDRGVRADDFVVITDTSMPAVLVETGFLSDPEERRLLQDEAYQKKLAEAIAAGIMEYLEGQDGEDADTTKEV